MQHALELLLGTFVLALWPGTRADRVQPRLHLGADFAADVRQNPLWTKWETGEMAVSEQHWIALEGESLSGVSYNGFFGKKPEGTESYSFPSITFEMSLKCSTPGPFATSKVSWTTSDELEGETMWGFQTAKTVVLWEKGWVRDGFGTTDRYERAGGQFSHGSLHPEVYRCSGPLELELQQFLLGEGLRNAEVFSLGKATINGLSQQTATNQEKGTLAFEFTQACDNTGVNKLHLASPYCFPGKKGLVVLSLKRSDGLSVEGPDYSALRVTLYLEK